LVTREFPKSELYGMTSQIRRAATSIAANIAEGHGRETSGSYLHALRIAQGSLKEFETHLIVAERVGLITSDILADLLKDTDEVGRMLRALIRTIQETVSRND
jgi:four helix bundle protein